MGKFGITELLIILAIVLLLFGTKRLKSLGSDLGSAIKGFKNSVGDDKQENVENDKSKDEQANEQAKEKLETKENVK